MDFLKKNKLILAALALGGLLGAIFYADTSRQAGDAPTVDTDALADLIPELDPETIDELEIQRPDEEAVVLAKEGETWLVRGPGIAEAGAPADESSIEQALEKLSELEVTRVVADTADLHERLEVDDSNGIRVVARQGGEELLAVVLGAYASQRTMVRFEGEDRVLGVDGSIKYAFNRDLDRWRDRSILSETAADVVAATFTHGEQTFRFIRGEDDEWVQAEGEAPLERFAAAKVQTVISSLVSMNATTFAEANMTLEDAGLGEGAARVELTLRDGTDDAEEGEDEGTAEEESTPTSAETRTIVLFGSEQGPEDSNHYARVEGDDTIYVVSSYHGDRLLVTAESFQDEPPEEDDEEESDEGSPTAAAAPPSAMLTPEQMQQIQAQIAAQAGML